ncbi:MAG: nucleotidyltransferase family protein [Colwelliaceae bacterium]|nr:nucleotidyltransferase family protein [Colwelliaceae bacterium]
MAEQLTHQEKMFTEDTIKELANWLIIGASYTENQLEHFKNEKFYLPLISLANEFWLIGALTQQLKDKNVWSLLPDELTNYLSEIEKIYRERSLALSKEAIYCCRTFQKKNIEVIMLKGITGLFNGSYKVISERYMTDIDLLVKEEVAQESFKELQRVGYAEQAGEFDIRAVEHHHLPPLIRENGCCFIELHMKGLKESVSGVLNTEEIWQKSIGLTLENNLNVLQLHPTHQLILAIAHSELSDKNFDNKVFDLKQVHNAYIIAQFYYQDIEWSKVQEHFSREKSSHVLDSMLNCIYTLFHFSTPITKVNDALANQHVKFIIEKYITTQGKVTLISRINSVIKGYSEETIVNLYGKRGSFPILNGRIKHFSRHCKIVIKNILSTFNK